MAQSPPSAHTIFQGLACPECGCAQSHVQDVKSGTGIYAHGRSGDREGAMILLLCEAYHAYIVGIGEVKGDAFMYARLPLGGEVVTVGEYYDGAGFSSVKFSGRQGPTSWSPKSWAGPGECYPLGNFSILDSGMFR